MRTNTRQLLYMPGLDKRANFKHDLLRDCIGWWPLTETAGFATDISEHGNHATKEGANWESTILGYAFENGASSVGLDAGTGVSSLLASSDITVSFWLNSNMSGTRSHILGNYNGNSGSLLVRRDGANFRVYKDAGGSVVFNANMVAGSWYHIAFTFNSSGNFKAYVNGTGTQNTGASRSATDNGQSFQIGSRPDTPTNQTLDGYIQNVRIWDRTLLKSEVFELYINPWVGLQPTTTVIGPRYFYFPSTPLSETIGTFKMRNLSFTPKSGGRTIIKRGP